MTSSSRSAHRSRRRGSSRRRCRHSSGPPRSSVPPGHPSFLAHALIRQAALLRAMDRREAAAAVIEEARATVDSCADPRMLAAVACGSRATATDATTKRRCGRSASVSVVILRMLTGRLSERDIGRELYLSHNTIHSHTRSIYRKLGASSRSEALDERARARSHLAANSPAKCFGPVSVEVGADNLCNAIEQRWGRRGPMRSSKPSSMWCAGPLLSLAAIAALACSIGANGSQAHFTAAPTLVVDNSFALDTVDPQRAFDPTSAIVDRAIYDTLFTYRGNDVAPSDPAARPLLDEQRRHDVHLPAQARCPLRRRYAADFRRRRLLAEAARQPEGESVVPPHRCQSVGDGYLHGRRQVEHCLCRSCGRSSRTRRRASSTRRSSERTGAPTASTPPRPTRPSTGSTRPHPPAPAAGRTCSSRTARPRRSRFERTRTTGARRSPPSARSSSATCRPSPS